MTVTIQDDGYWNEMCGFGKTVDNDPTCPFDVLGSFETKSVIILSHFHIGISGCTATNRVSLSPDTFCQNLFGLRGFVMVTLGARATGVAPGTNSIWSSTWKTRGRPGSSSGKTSRNSLTTVPSQMTHIVAIITLNSARYYVMQVAIVVAVVLVIVDMIIGIVFVVIGAPSIIKLAFLITGWMYAFHQDKASSIWVPVTNVTLFSSTQLLRENTDSVRLNQQMSPTAPSVLLKLKG
uniref:Uncharacterized protein n=1 Tax=Tanacetum cinerariifolium TaxID=118510 RepID=A0A6L2JGS4_TANCI|nr:hypothetical protein [Tanacetum cinerariifolium]